MTERSTWPSDSDFRKLLVIFVIALIIPSLYYDLAVTKIIELWLKYPILTNLIGILVILGVGWLLNAAKKKFQKYYGIAEVGLSVLGALLVINRYLEAKSTKPNFIESLNIIVPFITAIYFSQRGFNNFYDGRDKELKAAKERENQSNP